MRHITRIIFLLSAFMLLIEVASAQNKQQHLYAVKGADSLYLDHYVAPVTGERPCMVFLFGGGFVGGTRDNKDYLPYFEMLTRNGIDVVSIDYRLGLRSLKTMQSMPDIRTTITMLNNAVNIAVEDLYSATLFILENAKQWNIDTKAILTSGSSAGAITVLQAENGICNRTNAAAVLPKGFRYAGVISYAGAIFSVNGKPKWGTTPAPTMFFHGSADRQVPYEKATMFGIGFYGPKYLVKEYEKEQWPHWFYDIEYHTHAVSMLPMYENHNEILTFIKEYALKRREIMMTTTVKDKSLGVQPTKFKVKDYIKANFGQ